MPQFVVSTIFKGKDLLSPIFKRQGILAGKFGDKASRSFAKASKKAINFGDIVKGILTAGLIQRGISALTRGARTVTSEFIDFDQALTQAGAKFDPVVKRGTESFRKLGEIARKVGAETQFTAADAAQGLDFLAMAGFNAAQAMSALPGVTDIATIANLDLAESTSIAVDSLGAFNLMTKDSVQLEKNLSRVTDVMAKTITSANTDMQQLFETMKFAGPVATAAGASIETFNVFAAEMANAGIKGSLAGTALRTAFIALSGPVPKAQKLLKKLNVETKDSSGNMRDLMDIMDDIRKSTAKMGTAQKAAALNTIFGRRAVAGMSVILNASSRELRDFRQELENASGTSKRMATDIRKSIGNRLKELKSALIEIGFRFIEAFVGGGEKGLDTLIAAVRRFDVKPIVNGIKSIINVIKVAVDGFKIFAEALSDLKGVIIAVTSVVIAAKVAQWAWNAAMLANPIGILITAIAAAIVVIVILTNKWNSAKATIELAVLGLRNAFLTAFEAIQRGVIKMINAIISAFNQIPGISIPQLKIPDESAKIQRQVELIRARNKLLIAAVKDSEELQKKAMIVGESIRGREQAAIYRQFEIPELAKAQTEFAPIERTIDPELIQQQIQFRGEIGLRGAPEGTTFTGKTQGAPPIKTEMLGLNL